MSQNLDILAGANSAIPNLRRFAHPAMATIFEIFIIAEDAVYAQQAAQEVFAELDRLEQELSRFLANSDIARLNQLAAHQPLRLGPDTFDCLQSAQQIWENTQGAFDVTVGALLKCWLRSDKSLRSPTDAEIAEASRNLGMHLLDLDAKQCSVTLRASPVHVDLGAIGKGYAVEAMANLLAQWEIDIALLHGGRSTVFALGAPPGMPGWPVVLNNPREPSQVLHRPLLHNQALSGSGLQKGQHIINPRTAQPLANGRAAWALTPSATTSDAISTAFMIMEVEEIEAYCRQHPEVSALILAEGGEGIEEFRFGSWELVWST